MLEGKKRMLQDAEIGAVYFELLFGCCSVIAIDHIPLYEAFNLSVLDNEKATIAEDPLEMSLRLRQLSSRLLANLLWSDTIPIGDKLVEFYKEKILGRKVQSSLDKEIEDKVRYVCPLDDCNNYEFFKPEIDSSGVETKYFCKHHGIELVKTIELLKELDVPLA